MIRWTTWSSWLVKLNLQVLSPRNLLMVLHTQSTSKEIGNGVTSITMQLTLSRQLQVVFLMPTTISFSMENQLNNHIF
jgi:hypothetical protein